jgi:hypothetical protein
VHVEALACDGFVDKRNCRLGGAFALAHVVLDVLDRAACAATWASTSPKLRSGVSKVRASKVAQGTCEVAA